jgi:hypothetical protein
MPPAFGGNTWCARLHGNHKRLLHRGTCMRSWRKTWPKPKLRPSNAKTSPDLVLTHPLTRWHAEGWAEDTDGAIQGLER